MYRNFFSYLLVLSGFYIYLIICRDVTLPRINTIHCCVEYHLFGYLETHQFKITNWYDLDKILVTLQWFFSKTKNDLKMIWNNSRKTQTANSWNVCSNCGNNRKKWRWGIKSLWQVMIELSEGHPLQEFPYFYSSKFVL